MQTVIIGVDFKQTDMNINKKISLIVISITIALSLSQESIAQDPVFTQFYSNPLYLNPAFAGSRRCPRFVMNYRNEWPGISGNFITMAAAYDQKVESLHGGVGLLIMNDNAAKTMKTTRVAATYSYHLQVNRKFSINFGAEAAFFQKSLDWSKLTFGDMIDPRRGFVYQTNDVPRGGTASNIDVSSGIIGYTEHFFVGLAAHHMNQPNESLLKDPNGGRLPMRITGHAGAMIPLSGTGPSGRYSKSNDYISPNIIYTHQGNFQQLNMGLYVRKGNLTGGVWYRNKDAFILSLGIESDYLRIGYSYDVTVSKLGMATSGSHEVSLGFYFDCKPKRRQFRTISCPSF